MTETETFDELDRALGTVPFDGETVIARAVMRGRRLQRRRRLGAGVGVLALGALATTTPILLSPSDSTTGSPTDHTADGGLASPAQVDARLAVLLPGPSRQGFQAPQREGNDIQVERTLDPDGLGRGEVNLSLQIDRALRPGEIAGLEHECDQLRANPRGDDCQRVPGGWLLTSFEPSRPSGTKDVDWSAHLLLKNGLSVSLGASNYVHLGVPPSRTAPVLDAEQLVRLVTDPGWLQLAS